MKGFGGVARFHFLKPVQIERNVQICIIKTSLQKIRYIFIFREFALKCTLGKKLKIEEIREYMILSGITSLFLCWIARK